MSSDYTGYRRGLLRWLEHEGLEYHGGTLSVAGTGQIPTFGTNFGRNQAWLRESLLWTIDELEAGRVHYAFRGLLQVAQYSANGEGDSIAMDAFRTLKADLEDHLRGAEKAQRELELVLQDARAERGDSPNFLYVDQDVTLVIQARDEATAEAYAREWAVGRYPDEYSETDRLWLEPMGPMHEGIWGGSRAWMRAR
jgi:hypothetical protein